MKPSRSQFVDVRGLRYHVRTWGPADARKLVLLHGWMDVSASFQFLVDALAGAWHVMAPDWRGFGLSQIPQDGYWFADYVADLDALVASLSPSEPVAVAGHSLGANVALMWAGARPAGASHVIALDGFGVPAESPEHAPRKLRRWLDAVREPTHFAPYRDLAAVADRLQKNNPRLARDKAEFLAPHWAEVVPDGSARLRADPKHKLPFPTTSRMDDGYAIWREIKAPVLWVAAKESDIGRWLTGGGDVAAEIARRFAHIRNGRLEFVADAGHMLHHDQPVEVARLVESFLALTAKLTQHFLVHTRRGAYAALVILTIIWGLNWIAMKFALQYADPVMMNVQRTWLAVIVLWVMLVVQGGPLWPASWVAVVVTGFFQTTLNFTSTTMAVASGDVGRISVLVYTMPFWTLLIAWPVLHERVHGSQWIAVVLAFAGLVLIVEPWQWSGAMAPKLWAVLSGFAWATGTVCTKYFQRKHALDPLNFIAWQMLVGVLPLTLLPLLLDFAPVQWNVVYALLLVQVGAVATAFGFLLWIAILRHLPAGTASLNIFAIPVIALASSMLAFGERLSRLDWVGIACIAAGLLIISVAAWRASRRGEEAPPAPTPLDGG